MRQGSTPDRVAAILEADGGWLGVAALEAEYLDRFGPVNRRTLARATYRLCDAGVLSSRLVMSVVERDYPHPSGPWEFRDRDGYHRQTVQVAEFRAAA